MSKKKRGQEVEGEPHFLCGSHGCEVVSLSQAAMDASDARRRAWARAYHDEHGEFPDMEAQLQFVEDAYMEEEAAEERRNQMRIDR